MASPSPGNSEKGTLLVLIVDTNAVFWKEQEPGQFQALIESIIIFCNAHLLLHRENMLRIITCNQNERLFVLCGNKMVCHDGNSKVIFPNGPVQVYSGCSSVHFGMVKTTIISELQKIMASSVLCHQRATSQSSKALSMALCCKPCGFFFP
jgi:hypothetical protein